MGCNGPGFFSLLFSTQAHTIAGGIGDPGASLNRGTWAFGPEVSGVGREISDRDNVRYDTESWRLLLKGAYGIVDWLEAFGRLGGATLKIRGTSFDSSLGIAAGGGLKGTFLDPPDHPLRYSLGGQFLYMQTDSQGATAKWFEYDMAGRVLQESERPYSLRRDRLLKGGRKARQFQSQTGAG